MKLIKKLTQDEVFYFESVVDNTLLNSKESFLDIKLKETGLWCRLTNFTGRISKGEKVRVYQECGDSFCSDGVLGLQVLNENGSSIFNVVFDNNYMFKKD